MSGVNALDMRRTATISPCGKYRYDLTRQWRWGHSALGSHLLPIIMLNPSTADADVDDPTIRRCISFARREGFDGIRVVNLFAYRATSPGDMKIAADPFGPEGSAYIERTLEMAAVLETPVLAAWGAHGGFRARDEAVRISAKGWGARLVCLGVTAAGHPRHPLYVKGDQPFVAYPA